MVEVGWMIANIFCHKNLLLEIENEKYIEKLLSWS